jgi:hypothetical protein
MSDHVAAEENVHKVMSATGQLVMFFVFSILYLMSSKC